MYVGGDYQQVSLNFLWGGMGSERTDVVIL
jgi:hypothetical protein